jgi:hypothetical protein
VLKGTLTSDTYKNTTETCQDSKISFAMQHFKNL